ncbi:MAG: SpoIID/LytB domain-containing protein [Cyanobacteriota bacterium]
MVRTGTAVILQGCRRYPVLFTAPLALAAVGIGFGAQALLRPDPSASESDVLAALIAQPGASGSGSSELSTTTTGPASSPAAPPSAADLRAQRLGSTAAGAVPAAPAGKDLGLEIRVALLKLSANPSLSASGPWRISSRDGRVLQQGGGGEAADVGALLSNEAELWIETGAGGHLLSDGQPYSGRFRVLRGSDGLQVINHLPLESYISSVVGGEMPSSWNLEALRAQAVAARSYALAHMARPADPHWHLGDTTRWQNYTGLSSVDDRTREATESTAGVILSYQGGIVESLYAATHQLTQEAHGHLGASMSQHGAQDLAQQGLRYNEILGRYYRGASLARLQAGAG